MAISILNDLLLFSCLAALHCLHFANLGVWGRCVVVLTKTVSAIQSSNGAAFSQNLNI